MRKIREALRLRYAAGLSAGQVAASVPLAHSTVVEYARRFAAAGLSGPLPATLSDTELERRLFPPACHRGLFRREAMAASALNHPNICTIHDLYESGGRTFIVMELVEGRTLHAALARGPLPPAEALPIAVQIADALAEAHRAGILHRDIKSGNIVLTPRGQVKVLDFGLAKRLGAAGESGAATPETLTREGTTLGTLSYMSPERLLGKAVDRRSDLFSFGVVLYEMATGRLPFPGVSTAELFKAILSDAPAPPSGLAALRSVLDRHPRP